MKSEKHAYWEITVDKNEQVNIIIRPIDINDFANKNGFGKYYIGEGTRSIYIRNVKGILTEVSAEQIKDHVLAYARNLPESHDHYKYKEKILNELLNKRFFLLSENLFNNLPVVERELLRDTAEYSLIPFANGILKIEKDKFTLLDYNSSEYCVWKDQIRPQKFSYTDEESDFEKFLKNITGNNPDRYATIKSAFGYLVNTYKHKSITKAVIFCEEKFDALAIPEGRTGKSLIGQAISNIRKVTDFPGKSFNPKDRFAYQSVSISTQVLFLNDVEKDFKFEQMFTVIADGLHIEKKNKDKIFLPYEDSPKVLINTNYSILGRSASYRARMFEVALAPYYNDNFLPIDEFKKEFFSKDWDESDWNKFYSFVVRSVQLYLNNSLIPYEDENIQQRKDYQEFGEELIEYFETKIKLGVQYDKKVLYNGFKLANEGAGFMTQRTFTEKLMSYAYSQKWKTYTRKSDGDSFIKFEK